MSPLTLVMTTLVLTANPTGELRGQAVGATAIQAIERMSGQRYPAKLADDGTFTIAMLPLTRTTTTEEGDPAEAEARYDLVVDYPGVRLEGVNLHVRRSDFEEEQPMPEGGRERVVEIMKQLSKFEDTFQVLAVDGNIQHAVVFVSKLRTRPFYESKPGEVIWRTEVWRFERLRPEEPEDPWIKSPDALGVLHYRERLQKADFEKKSLVFDPALGGLLLTKTQPIVDVGTITPSEAKPGIRLRDARQPMK
jgi:hypothetical protein